jgi:hypothetical protein
MYVPPKLIAILTGGGESFIRIFVICILHQMGEQGKEDEVGGACQRWKCIHSFCQKYLI